jgi:PAS domain S-box-containing protein
MALVLAACGVALAFARAPDLATQVVALTIVRATLWIGGFWQLAYVTLAGDFTRLFDCPASLTFQVGLVLAIIVWGALMLRGDRRWLATLTGADNSLALPRYILPLAVAPVVGAYVIWFGVRSRVYGFSTALLFNVEFVSILLVLSCSAGVRFFWRRRQAREDRARALQEAPVIVLSADGRIEYWPRECERMFGFAAEEALGSHIPNLLKTQYPQPLDEIVATLRAEGRWVGVVRHMTRNGRPLRIASTIAMHQPAAGGEVKVVATMTDITDLET